MRLRIAAIIAAVTAAIPGTAVAGQPQAQPANPGFEADGGGTAAPAGWSEQGQQAASFTEAGGHTGSFRLTHWAAEAYQVVTSQRLRGLREGTYTLRAWVRSSGDQASTSLSLTNCGGKPEQVALPRTGPEWWVQIAVSARVEDGECTISVRSDAHAGDWINVDDLEFTRSPAHELEIKGADVSQLAKNEHYGAVYKDAKGKPQDALRILKSNGVNYLRLKVWVDSADGFHEQDCSTRWTRSPRHSGSSTGSPPGPP